MDGITVRQLAEHLGREFDGPADARLHEAASLRQAAAGALSFAQGEAARGPLRDTGATAVIVDPGLASDCPAARILSPNPRLDFAHALEILLPVPEIVPGVAASARVAASATVAAGARVAEGAILGEEVRIEDGAVVEAGAVIEPGCRIGPRTRVGANTVVRAGSTVGADCTLHPGVIIGADGFGFVPDGAHWRKLRQLGSVRIGDRVEMGANTTVDRGALEDTVIEDGVKLDNQIQVAHNVRIGADTLIAGCTAIAGSVDIGHSCTIAGGVGIAGHLSICPGVTITAMTLVSRSIEQPGVYSGSMPMDESGRWRRTSARLRSLDELARRVRKLEQQLDSEQQRDSKGDQE